MFQIIHHQINVADISGQIEYLKELETEEFFLVGVEITHPDIFPHLHLNIDPQHDLTNKTDMTSIEYIFNYEKEILPIISTSHKIFICTLKPDIDSIATMAIITLMLNKDLVITNDIVLRLKAIAQSDRHGRQDWKKRKIDYFTFENYNVYGLPIGLQFMISDNKITTEEKIEKTIAYLKTGTFDNLNNYNQSFIYRNKKPNQTAIVNVIIPKKLVFISSNRSGAISYGYRFAPVVIAKHNKYRFGIGIQSSFGKKYTVAQYADGNYIDLPGFLQEVSELERGWGGSPVIVGSPQDKSSELNDDTVISIVKKYVKE